MKNELIGLLRPFRGSDVRRMCAMFTLAVGLPRLPVWGTDVPVSLLGILPAEVFGWVFLALGFVLLATNGQHRHRPGGRLVAFVALVLWALLTGATNSITSQIINVGVMWAMVGEIGASSDDL